MHLVGHHLQYITMHGYMKVKTVGVVYFAYFHVTKYFRWIYYIKFYSNTLSGAK